MAYRIPGRGWKNEIPTAREQEVLDAVDRIAAMLSTRRGAAVGGTRDVTARAVQVYLIKASLGWGLCRIGRRLGNVSLRYTMKLYPRGRKLIASAVETKKITPRIVASLLPEQVYI